MEINLLNPHIRYARFHTAVASGMKGILWFFVYMRTPVSNYRLAPIDEFGERTETYTWMSRVNRHFQHQFGDFFHRANTPTLW